jgi:hypothetical protein
MDDFFAAFGGPEPAPRGNSEQAPTQAAVAAPPDLPLGIARGLPGKCLPAATSMPIASAGWPEYLAVTVARFAPGALPTCLCVSRGWHGCGVAEARAAACSGGLTLRPHAGVEGVRLACRWIPEELAELSLRFRYHRFYCRAGDDGAQTLAAALPAGLTRLSLCFRNCRIGDDGAQTLWRRTAPASARGREKLRTSPVFYAMRGRCASDARVVVCRSRFRDFSRFSRFSRF